MGEFLKGWRRKTGCVTLVMAIVSSTWWARSLVVDDEIFGNSKHYGFHFRSINGRADAGVYWARDGNLSGGIYWQSGPSTRDRHPFVFNVDWGKTPEAATANLAMPHWSVATPLMLLSAYLLLAKPRMPAPKTTVEPKAAEEP